VESSGFWLLESSGCSLVKSSGFCILGLREKLDQSLRQKIRSVRSMETPKKGRTMRSEIQAKNNAQLLVVDTHGEKEFEKRDKVRALKIDNSDYCGSICVREDLWQSI
jgi:hypothetical protein